MANNKTQDKTPRLAVLGTRGIPARYGGFETFAEELAVGLVEQGYEVTVYCERGAGPQLRRYKGVRLKYVPSPKLGPLTTVVFDLLCLWRARRGFDLVYMLGYGASFGCFIPRLWGTKVWINMDGIEWARSKWGRVAKAWFKTMEALAMVTPNRLIADAHGIYAHLRSRYRHMPPVSVIPYGAPLVDPPPPASLLAEWNLEPGSYDLVVCRLEPENHILEILRGVTASGSSVPLVVVGDRRTGTPYVRELLAVKDQRIRFIGTVFDQHKLQALRCHCRAYFHGHSVGGTNPSLLEALGCGNPVIAHDNPFNREVAGDAAVYFSGAEGIPALVQELDQDPAKRKTMAAAARARIRDRYTWNAVVTAYQELIDQETGRGTDRLEAEGHRYGAKPRNAEAGSSR